MDSKQILEGARAFLATIPFNTLLDIRIARLHKDGLTLSCKVRKELLNSNGVLHGGVYASLADAAVGVAVQQRFLGTRTIATVEMKINYFRSLSKGMLYARAHLLRVGSTLAVGSVDLTDGGKDPVGAALVTYIFLDARRK